MVSMTRSKLSTCFRRITQNRLSFSFFLFSFIASFAQGILHSLLFSVDSEYNDILHGITKTAALPPQNHTYLQGGSGYWALNGKGGGELSLIMCNEVPYIGCFDLFKSSRDLVRPERIEQDAIVRGQILSHHAGILITAIDTTPRAPNDTAVILKSKFGQVALNRQCTQILNYPQQHMHSALREDLTLVIFQFWLFAMSIYAMVNDSVPHILAPLFARVLLLGWSSYAIMRTHHQKLVFYELVEKAGSPCSVQLFSGYFGVRMGYEIADIILNTSACATAAYLSWTLLKVYNAQSFKCVGAPEAITKLHKYVLALLAVLHLALFVILTAISLWIDQLANSYVKLSSLHTDAYLACFILTCIFVVPWIGSGYNATTRERHRVMLVFIGIGGLLIFGWSLMFYSQVYRWTFIMWPYLGCHTVASFLLIITSIILGVICRINFGKGLAQYLRAESVLSKSNFKPELFEHDAEKALSSEESPSPSPVSSTHKMKLSLTTTGIPLVSPGVVISPSSKTTKEEQQWRGERESHLPIPTYYLSYAQSPLEPKRKGSDSTGSSPPGYF